MRDTPKGGWGGDDNGDGESEEISTETELERELMRVQRRETTLQEQLVTLRAALDAKALHAEGLEAQLEQVKEERDFAVKKNEDLQLSLQAQAADMHALRQLEEAATVHSADLQRAVRALQANVDRCQERINKEQADRATLALELQHTATENKRLLVRDTEREELERELKKLRLMAVEQEKNLQSISEMREHEKRHSTQTLTDLSDHVAYLRSSTHNTPRSTPRKDEGEGEQLGEIFTALTARTS
eukprot:CAMPEP_0179486318 /NCGR_PEP_ID=MMETSP0799-20121207/62661_1 /TAXON_ID=46947 /ORGANISM="Geminigera cryophila, Strain CCMP2564" /LENGTH=244 /DNA_ID=CAMNT_0021301035 /DNA_START=100 /DNA_END=831 /DNA_ORIENTATION=-